MGVRVQSVSGLEEANLRGDVRADSIDRHPETLLQSSFGSESASIKEDFNKKLRLVGGKVVLSAADSKEIDPQLIDRAVEDLEQVFSKLCNLTAAITVFGSARITEDDPDYKMAVELGRELANEGFVVISGGGPSLMEAANKGAKQAGGVSIGLNIILEKEQGINPYVDISHEFDDFFTRKVGLRQFSCGFVAMPGGFGTLDELFEILTLRQTKKMKDYPVVLMGKSYWEPVMSFFKNTLMERGLISPNDLDNVILTNSPKEAARHLKKAVMSNFGVKEEIVFKKAA